MRIKRDFIFAFNYSTKKKKKSKWYFHQYINIRQDLPALHDLASLLDTAYLYSYVFINYNNLLDCV